MFNTQTVITRVFAILQQHFWLSITSSATVRTESGSWCGCTARGEERNLLITMLEDKIKKLARGVAKYKS